MLSEARHPLLGRIALATVATGAALSLSACGLPLLPPAFSGGLDDPTAESEPEPESEPTEAEETEESTEEPEPFEAPTEQPLGPEDQDVNVLVVGDCLNEMEVSHDDSVSTVPIVDCSEPHDLEVYYGNSLDRDLEYPGREEVVELVDEGCYEAFETFVGIPAEQSALVTQTLFPLEEGWDLGERDYLWGVAPVALFMRALGVRIVSPRKVYVQGRNPFPWPVTGRHKGLVVARGETETVVTFPSGHTAVVSGEAPQVGAWWWPNASALMTIRLQVSFPASPACWKGWTRHG